MIRILLIPSSDYLGHPFPQRHNHIFERLHDKKEFEVHVIRFNIFGKPKLASKCIIHEIPLEIKLSNTALYYAVNTFNFTNEILKIAKQESIDIVVAGNLLPPLTYTLTRQLLERKIPLVLDLQDYYPTSAAGYIVHVDSTLGVLVKGFFELITQYLISAANVVIVPGIALAMYARKVGARMVKIIPNGISEHFLKKHRGEKVRKRLGYRKDDIVIGYVGSVEFWLDMETLIKAIALAYKRGLPVKFLIIGKHLQTGYPCKVEKWIKRYSIGEITTWLGFVPHQKVPEYIAAMNIGTIPFEVKNPTAYYAAPNKIWEYLSQDVIVASAPIPEVLFIKERIITNNTKEIKRNMLHIVRDEYDYITTFTQVSVQKTSKENKEAMQRILRSRLWSNIASKYGTLIKLIVDKARSKSALA